MFDHRSFPDRSDGQKKGFQLVTPEELTYIQHHESIIQLIKLEIDNIPFILEKQRQEVRGHIEALSEQARLSRAEDLPAIFQSLEIQSELLKKLLNDDQIPNGKSPYFGHLKIMMDRKIKDFFIGHSALSLEGGIKIIDWRRAPLAKVFYSCEEGEEFDLLLEDRELSGSVMERSLLTINDGSLVRIDRGKRSFLRHKDNWVEINEVKENLAGGEGQSYRELGTGATHFTGPEATGLLDQRQYQLVQHGHKPLLLVGTAGSGKTTVALVRLANLCQERKLYPGQAMILVPNKGLVALSKKLLEEVGLEHVKIRVVGDWIEQLIRKILPDLPRLREENDFNTAFAKRHPAMAVLIKDFALKKKGECQNRLEKILSHDELVRWKELKDISILEGLKQLKGTIQENLAVIKIIEEFSNLRELLFSMLTDRVLLQRLVDYSQGEISRRLVDLIFQETSRSLHSWDENSLYLHQDSSNFTDEQDGISMEDMILMLGLTREFFGHLNTLSNAPAQWRHLVLDEAQELGPLELNIIGDFIHREGTLTVAGDGIQQIDKSLQFLGWSRIMEELGYKGVMPELLNVSYRSPRPIVTFAHRVLGPLAPEMPECHKDGQEVIVSPCLHLAHAGVKIVEVLRVLLLNEPKARIGVICHSDQSANDLFSLLEELGGVRRSHLGSISLAPGVEVTTVEQVRGLEFDYVIIPDADREAYPENERARKRLHLAVTRAIHQLWVLHGPNKSALI